VLRRNAVHPACRLPTHVSWAPVSLRLLPRARRVNFTGNRGGSGGALSLTLVSQPSNITNCTFHDNLGFPETGAAPIADSGCSRDALGGGGALCVSLRGKVVLDGGELANNSAVSGGAIYVQRPQSLCDDVTNPSDLMLLLGARITKNSAVRGGGGAVFRTTYDIVNVTCANGTALPWDALNIGCRCAPLAAASTSLPCAPVRNRVLIL
jgi:hypothetical protein